MPVSADPYLLLSEALLWLRPELLLATFALLGALIGAWGGPRLAGPIAVLAAASLCIAGAMALVQAPLERVDLFNGAYAVDAFSSFAKAVLGFSAAATLLLSADQFGRAGDRRFEYSILIVLAVLGMFVMVSAADLITLYLGIELQSLAAYVLAAWRRDDAKSSEAGLKYFVLGALSSGLLLFGASYIYGFAGSVKFTEIAVAAANPEVGLTFGLVFMICGLAFKMSAAPFHMWTPDVYEGAATPVTAFFAAAPKLAAVALTTRLLIEPFGQMTGQWQQVVVVISGLSMVVGAILALVQTNLKRLMAYSSINNIGFALMGVSAGGALGASATLIYMTIYLPTTIGLFALILSLRRGTETFETISDLSGLAQRKPWLGALATVLLFSVVGIPPLAGFWGKWAVFQAAIAAGLWPLAVVGALCAVVAAGYYLRLIGEIWFSPTVEPYQPVGPSLAMTAGFAALLAFPLLAIGFGVLSRMAQGAAVASFP